MQIARNLWLILLCLLCGTSAVVALEFRTYPEFAQLVAIQTSPDGGFGLAGYLRTQPGRVQSGFLRIGSNGERLGRPLALPPPDEQHPQTWVSGLLLLPDGDYVAAGWAENPRGKPDGWLIRFTPEGEVVWNVILASDQDQRIYSVKRHPGGSLIAVGRVQEGSDIRQRAQGYLAFVDPLNGKSRDFQIPFNAETRRSAFQDVAVLPDGALAFTGWVTKADGTDDIWLLRLNQEGGAPRSIPSLRGLSNPVSGVSDVQFGETTFRSWRQTR